jgi:formylglycine-generating enzyme required for sulfatase activity
MEIIIGIVGILVTIFGGLAWLVMMLGHLKGRLDAPLENKQFFEQAEREFKQKLETMLEAAQRRLNNDLNPEQILQKIETAQQQAMQQTEESLSGLKTALQELEVAKQRALDEITQASSLEPLLAIEQRINQSIEEFRSKIAEVGNQADARRLALEQDAEQFLVKTQKQLVELEQQREKVTSEIAKIKSDALKELQQEVVKLKQLVMQPAELEQQREKVTSEIAKIKSDALKELQQEVVKLKQLVVQPAELEQQREKVTSEIVKIKSDATEELNQEIDKLKQSVVQPADPLTDFAETLPEITFETAFIDSNQNIRKKNIRRETRTARQLVETLPNNVKLEMIYVPGGTFMMGSNESDGEKPMHSVTLKPFLVGKYPVTQAQWEAIMGNNPSKFKGANRPVETVTWNDVMQCCAKLSQLTGHQYRLLSEAQWEYACRAGSVTKYSFGEIIAPELANYGASGIKQTTEVGKYPANAFGLYDMHGNVWEWCEDVWHGNYVGAPSDGSAWMAGDSNIHLLRGGSWNDNGNFLRWAHRFRNDATFMGYNWGFRISRVTL